jgi:hypothetical protein
LNFSDDYFVSRPELSEVLHPRGDPGEGAHRAYGLRIAEKNAEGGAFGPVGDVASGG